MRSEPSKTLEGAIAKARARAAANAVDKELELVNHGIQTPRILRPPVLRKSVPVPKPPPQSHFSDIEKPQVVKDADGGWRVISE